MSHSYYVRILYSFLDIDSWSKIASFSCLTLFDAVAGILSRFWCEKTGIMV